MAGAADLQGRDTLHRPNYVVALPVAILCCCTDSEDDLGAIDGTFGHGSQKEKVDVEQNCDCSCNYLFHHVVVGKMRVLVSCLWQVLQ